MAEFNSIEFEIKGSADKATNSLLDFSKALEKVNNVSGENSGLKKLADILGQIGSAEGNGLASLASSLDSIAQHEAELNNVVRFLGNISRMDFSNLETAAIAMRDLSGALNNMTPQQQPQEQLVNDDGVSESASAFERFREAAAGAARTAGTLISKLGQLSISASRVAGAIISIPFKRAAESAKQFAGKLEKVAAAFKRIMFYRLIRSAIKALTDGFREGLQNAYTFSAGLSNAIDGRIATALDNLTGSATTMKNQLGAAFGSLLTALAPIINTLISLITSLANAITQLFAAFSGGTFLKAKNVTGKFADNMKAGGGAAKEWKNQLMGFDVINRLDNQNSGGGGGGSGGLNANDMFEVTPINEGIKNFVNDLKEAILNGDWQGVGALLGGKINELVAKVDWGGIGKKVGYFFNGVIQSLYYTLKTIDFFAIGAALAEFLNNAINEISWEHLGRLLVAKFLAAINFFAGLIYKLNWGQIAIAISDFISGALNEASEWLETFNWSEIAEKIKTKLIEFIDNLKAEEVAAALNRFVNKAFSALKDLVTGAEWNEVLEKLKTKFEEFWDALDPKAQTFLKLASYVGVAAIAFTLINGPLKTVYETFKLLFSPLGKFIIAGALVVLAIKNIREGFAQWNETGELSASVFADLVEGVGLLAVAIGLFTNPWLVLSGTIAVVVAEIIKHWDEIEDWWHNTTLGQSISETWDGIKESFATGKEELIGDWETMKTSWNTFVTDVQQLWESLRKTVSDKVIKIKQYFSDFKDRWDKKMEPLREAFENFKTSWSNAFDGVITAIQGVLGWLGALIDRIRIAISWLMDLIGLGSDVDITGNGGGGQFMGGWSPSSIHGDAAGGFEPSGQLFIAREAGPELVGTMGGRTAVANNDQIVSGIKEGVFEAVTAAMGGNSQSGQPIVIYLDGREIARSTTKYQNQMARAGAY